MAPPEVGSEAVRVVVKGDPREIPARSTIASAGTVAVMPLASPIGSGLGLLKRFTILTIKHLAHLAGRMPRREVAVLSSPLGGTLE